MRLQIKTSKATFITVAAAISTAVVTTLIAFGVTAGLDSAWWAAWGQWVGGVGSITAAGVALWIAYAGWARADAETERNDASRFAIWVEPGHDRTQLEVRYFNGGPLPVYDACAAITSPLWPTLYLRIGPTTVGPTDRYERHDGASKVLNDRLEEWLRWRFQVSTLLGENARRVDIGMARFGFNESVKVAFAYRASDRVWLRTSDQSLVAKERDDHPGVLLDSLRAQSQPATDPPGK